MHLVRGILGLIYVDLNNKGFFYKKTFSNTKTFGTKLGFLLETCYWSSTFYEYHLFPKLHDLVDNRQRKSHI